MPTHPTRKPVILVLSLLIALLMLSAAPPPAAPEGANGVLELRAPWFVRSAFAQDGSTDTAVAAPDATPLGFPEDEAGIAAYFKSTNPINLNNVKSVFKVIEAQTAEYILGSVTVTNYPDTEDVHVYVHKDGWFLAYYLAEDPVGKIFNWRQYDATGRTKITTKLEDTLALVTSTAGVSFLPGATHYHFKYPSATHLMLISEWTRAASDTFKIKVPGEYVYWEMSWSLGSDESEARLRLDGTELMYHGGSGWQHHQGKLQPAQLLPDQYHEIKVESWWRNPYAYAGLALLYSVP